MANPTPKNKPDQYVPSVYDILEEHKLPKVSSIDGLSFLEVLKQRRSYSRIGFLSERELSSVLMTAVRPKSISISEEGYYTSLRPSPSAGARHPVDIFIFRPDHKRKHGTMEIYNPIRHSVGLLKTDDKILQSFLNHVNQNKKIENSTLLWFGIEMEKTGAKYLNPESLAWRDCGALLMCIQLVATALDLKTCPIGTLANSHFHELLPANCILSGGGILIGK